MREPEQPEPPSAASGVRAGPTVPPLPAVPERTGDAQVDAALAGLDGIETLPVEQQVEQFDSVHRALATRLSAIDEV